MSLTSLDKTRPQTADKQELIINAALDLFRHYGYRRTAMEDIARAAGVVAEYQALLSSGLFARIDQNPFKPVSVAAGARAALAAISRTLA